MLQAKDIMTTPVITVDARATVPDVAELLLLHGISAVPVVSGDRLLGIVSEGDLLHREEIDTLPARRPWWLWLFGQDGTRARDYVKTHSRHVSDVMTREVATVEEETPLNEIAEVLERNRVRRVPVMRDGRLVGIVSRSNLIRALAVALRGAFRPASREDGEVRTEVLNALRAESWAFTGGLDASVSDGVVTLWGTCQSEDERTATRVLVENIPGVRGIDDRRTLIDMAYSIAYGAV